jgi:HKD family nuclease
MHAQRWFPQDRASGAIGQTLLGITTLAELGGYSEFRAGVAYATFNGCKILNESLRHILCWRKSSKRWLISIDYGRTEPAALKFLAKLPNAQVRVPNGLKVAATGGFMPATPFHPKAYAVDDIANGAKSMFGAFMGSGNLTGSGLLSGSECGVLSYWNKPNGAQQKAMFSAYQGMSWFETVWKRADPVSEIITLYEKRWKKSKPLIVEEDEDVVDLYIGGLGHVVEGDFAVALASAKACWIEVNELYKNRGANLPGNQVDAQRGTRVFFGFAPTAVPKNTMLGHVVLQNKGFAPVECSVRFGNNHMDKINLPIPGNDGPDSYDNSILLFERIGLVGSRLPKFRISVGGESDLKKWKKGSLSAQERTMRGGRRYGVLF